MLFYVVSYIVSFAIVQLVGASIVWLTRRGKTTFSEEFRDHWFRNLIIGSVIYVPILLYLLATIIPLT